MDIEVPEELQAVGARLRKGEAASTSVRRLLSWFDAERRGWRIVDDIRSVLASVNLETDPDFEAVHIDTRIHFQLSASQDSVGEPETSQPDPVTGDATSGRKDRGDYVDPIHRISRLEAANRAPIRVAPDTELRKAITLMLTNDFSQLPVMIGDREVKGMVSWESIGERVVLGQDCDAVRECMEAAQEVRFDDSLLDTARIIAQYESVLVRGAERKIVGIVTASDISVQFSQLAEPYLLLGQIENRIRSLIQAHFSSDDIKAAKDPSDSDRDVRSVGDLTFGEYVRLLADPAMWKKLGIDIDRLVFVAQLDSIRQIRNQVMHFDPDGVTELDLAKLRTFAACLERLRSVTHAW